MDRDEALADYAHCVAHRKGAGDGKRCKWLDDNTVRCTCGAVDYERGSGRTTNQMMQAPKDAVFVSMDSRHYAKLLARFIGRDDLKIICPDELHRLQGRELTGLIVDHAARLSSRQEDEVWHLLPRIRRPA